MRNIWLGSYNAAEWSMVKDPIYDGDKDGRLCTKKSGTSLYGKAEAVFEYTSSDTYTYGNAEYADPGTGSMEDVCSARCVAEPTCVAYVLTTDTSSYVDSIGCVGCNFALDKDNTIYSSGSQKTQSYTAYNKIKASDSVTAGTTTSTTSTTSTPGNMPSINITSTFQYLGCYKPPSSLTTDVDFVYTVPFDTSKYKAVPAFDRSLSGYHGWSNPKLFPLYIGCYQWSSLSTLKSSSIDMTDGMTPWKDSVATYDSATECKDL